MKLFACIIFLFVANFCNSQITLNAYAKVTAINSGAITLTITNVNEASHTFTVGGEVIVMQMQDDCIGTNTTSTSSFGNLATIANAGNYELRKIASRLPATGTPTSITLDFALTSGYSFGSNSSVQLISFRDLGINYTTTSNITGLAWDGNVGGIIALQVTNTLTLNHSISADGIGFRGGAVSSNADEACNNTFYTGNDANKGFKGEGIYKSTNSTFLNGLAKIITGGGGGSQNNAGGGGGGNYTSGGNGGLGWTCSAANSGKGFGGVSLSSFMPSRLFMGSGGGGGQQNNGVGTSGGRGGGIIFIKANTLRTNTVCTSAINITANGQSIAWAGNDGGGGGGAAGCIQMQILNFSISSTCTLAVNANGGTGGSVNSAAHGGGGGGGQGVIVYSASQPTTNVLSTTTNGLAGWDNTDGSVITGTSGGGSNNSGIFSSTPSPLPVELVNFYGDCDNDFHLFTLKWETLSETNNDLFILEKSKDGVKWSQLTQIKGSGNSSSLKMYQFTDTEISESIVYYRLKQVDFDKTVKTYNSVVYNDKCLLKVNSLNFFPNPSGSEITVSNSLNYTAYSIYNNLGQLVKQDTSVPEKIQINELSNGSYYIQFTDKQSVIYSKQLIVER